MFNVLINQTFNNFVKFIHLETFPIVHFCTNQELLGDFNFFFQISNFTEKKLGYQWSIIPLFLTQRHLLICDHLTN